jgi:hypothetical protein
MIRRMFQFAGLQWHPQSEAFVLASTQSSHSDYYSVFKDPKSSAVRWRSELSPEAIERILRIVRHSSVARFYPEDMQVHDVPKEVAS